MQSFTKLRTFTVGGGQMSPVGSVWLVMWPSFFWDLQGSSSRGQRCPGDHRRLLDDHNPAWPHPDLPKGICGLQSLPDWCFSSEISSERSLINIPQKTLRRSRTKLKKRADWWWVPGNPSWCEHQLFAVPGSDGATACSNSQACLLRWLPHPPRG